MAAGNGEEIRISLQWQQMGALWHVTISKTESFVQWQEESVMADGNNKKIRISVQWQQGRLMAGGNGKGAASRESDVRARSAWIPQEFCGTTCQAKALHWQATGRSQHIPMFIKKQNICYKACFLLLCTFGSLHLLCLAQTHCD